MNAQPPIFIACPARSGSTLLRYILDSHSDIVAPPESNLSNVAAAMQFVWMSAKDEDTDAIRRKCGVEAFRKFADGYRKYHLNKERKSYFCDKSLTNCEQFELLLEAYPEAKFITLYRHAMDMVASGVEASKWGYSAFGFQRYVNAAQILPGMIAYWCDRAESMMELERQATSQTIRIYYEHLVMDPTSVVRDVCDHLEVPYEPSMLATAFSRGHVDGHGDINIDVSTEVHTHSLGKGNGVPIAGVPPTLLTRMNSLLGVLEYPQVTPDWNTQPSPFRRAEVNREQHTTDDMTLLLQVGLGAERDATHEDIFLQFEDSNPVDSYFISFRERSVLRKEVAPDAGPTVVTSRSAFLELLSGKSNLTEMLHKGMIRFNNRNKQGSRPIRTLYQVYSNCEELKEYLRTCHLSEDWAPTVAIEEKGKHEQ